MTASSKIINYQLEGNIITDLSLVGKPEWWRSESSLSAFDHEKLAADIVREKQTVKSVLVFTDWLKEELHDDPRHAEKSTVVVNSAIEEEVERIYPIFSYPSAEKALEAARALGIEVDAAVATAVLRGESHFQVEDKIMHGYFAAMRLRHYPEILAEKKKEFRTHEPATNKRRKVRLQREEFEKAWATEIMRLLSPRTEQRYKRISPLQAPFSGFAHYQQYYLTQSADGQTLLWTSGDSRGSGTRYTQGRMAHALATLEDSGYPGFEGTLVIDINANNQAVWLGDFPGLKTSWADLSGNYPSNQELVQKLFHNKVVKYERATGTLTPAKP